MDRKAILWFSSLIFLTGTLSIAGGTKGPWIDRYLQVGDIKVHYLEAGTGDRTLVFVPGWLTAAEIWKEQIPYFSARGFRVIAFDPRSQGQTTRTETGNTYHQHAADLHAFLQNLEIEHSYLVGWAAGATTLLEYLSSPEILKPEKVVLIEGNPSFSKEDDYPGSATPQQARKLILSFQEDRAKALDQYTRSLFRASHPEILYKELWESSQKTPLAAAVSLFFDQFTGDRRPALKRVSVPCLIVTTTENQAIGAYMQSKMPRANLEVIENAGSALFLDKPQAFNQIVEAFLGEH